MWSLGKLELLAQIDSVARLQLLSINCRDQLQYRKIQRCTAGMKAAASCMWCLKSPQGLCTAAHACMYRQMAAVELAGVAAAGGSLPSWHFTRSSSVLLGDHRRCAACFPMLLLSALQMLICHLAASPSSRLAGTSESSM
jgi:hypothetical protein